jgi:tetratricopeptide (TPR) repeat protein
LLGVLEATHGTNKKEYNQENAEDCFRTAIRVARKFGRDFLPARANLANLKAVRGDFEGAISDLMSLISRSTNTNPTVVAVLYHGLAEVYAYAGRYGEAVSGFEHAIAFERKGNSAKMTRELAGRYLAIADALLKMESLTEEQVDKLEEALRRANSANEHMVEIGDFRVDRNERHGKSARLRGELAMRNGDTEGAVIAFKGSTTLTGMKSPSYKQISEPEEGEPNLLYWWGQALKGTGDYKRAAEKLQMAVKENPEIPEYHKALGDVFIELEKFEEGVSSYEEAQRLEPEEKARRETESRIDAAKQKRTLAGSGAKPAVEKAPSSKPCYYYRAATTVRSLTSFDISASP